MKDTRVKSDQKQNSATMLMTEGKIWKQLLVFAVPLILGNLLQQMYNAVDSIIVGNYVGSNALAAVGSSNALINLLIAFAQGASVGAGVVISQFLGAGDTKRVHRAVHTAATIALLLGVILTGAGIALSRALLQIQFLLHGFLVYGRNQTKNVRVPLLLPDCRVIEGSHSLASILFPLNIRIK